MISIRDVFWFVLKNMFEKKGRVFLTVSGIIIGIFTFTFFLFVAQGLENAITEQFSAFGLNTVTIRPAGSTGQPGGGGLTDTEIEKIKQVVKEYNYIAPGIYYSTNIEYGRETSSTLALAYPDEFLDELDEQSDVEILEGRDLRPGDKGAAVLGYKFAKEGFEKEITVGSSLEIRDKKFRVIGIYEEQGDLFIDNSVSMPFDDIKQISGQDTYSTIEVSLKEDADIEYYKEVIARKLNPFGKEKTVEISTSQDIIDSFNQIIGVLSGIISFVSSIALVVGGINVMNTMYSNVLERINEISVMKAMGSTNSDIRNIFLIESSLLGLIGAFIGFMLAYGLAELVSVAIIGLGYNVPINFEPSLFFGIILVTSFFAMIFGTYPALRAAHVNPADNLRDE